MNCIMQRTGFSDFACSVARTLDVVGEWWTPLILRDVFLGVMRFDAIQEDLGIPRKVLAERLATLVEHEVLEKVPYRDGRRRYEYHLTERGRDFITAIIAMMDWGDRWKSTEAGPPVKVRHKNCGGKIEAQLVCKRCGSHTAPDELVPLPGGGARAIRGTAVVARIPAERSLVSG